MSTRSTKTDGKTSSDRFSDFFVNASTEEKIAVFKEVARKATEDQRKIMKKAGLKIQTVH